MALDRREFLWHATVLLGGAVSASCSQAVLSRAPDEPFRTPNPELAGRERATLEAAVDRILPATATPGALDAGVPDFIEFVLVEGFDESERRRFREGLARLESSAAALHGGPFASLPGAGRDGILAAIEKEELEAAEPEVALFSGIPTDKAFFATLKELTVVGFFTSEIGATQVVAFSPWPGRFDGCLTPEPGAKPPFGRI